MAYTCTGSESAELAIKLARKYQRLRGREEKHRILALDKSYHGTYYGSMSASGIDQEISEGYGPKVPGFRFLPVPYCTCCDPEDAQSPCLQRHLEELGRYFAAEGDETAAVILEPVLGSAGVIPPPELYLIRVKELCREYDALLIFDEVATGFGRTGTLFALERTAAAPDIVCLSKGINSGYLPLGATVFHRRIYDAFASVPTHIEHLSTQNANPLACAAGLATLDTIEKEGPLPRVNELGDLLAQELAEALQEHKNFLEIRGKGLMRGVALVQSRVSKAPLSPEQTLWIVQKLKQRGLLVYPFYTLPLTAGFHLLPPFITTEQEIARMVQLIRQVMDRTVF
ncbi:aminotransferase class III-fold pyridoxal phosphate-dependent enzyme [Paenibacillus sp. P26]|nr:aminotransferase class III-fold pyridoxal phosphate-dependent enzyme [Paenibacillus sp. P26]